MSNHPTPTEIAEVIADVQDGCIFDPSEEPDCWSCNIYKGDRWFGEGQGFSAGEAAACAWIHAHAPDGLCNPEELVKVPRAVVAPMLWRFELTSPKQD